MFSHVSSEFFSWIRGALLLLFIINLGLYFQNRKRLFLNYSLYLLFVFLFLLKPVVSSHWREFYEAFGYSLLFFSFVFYVEFERVLLSSKDTIPKWDKYLRIKRDVILFFSLSLPLVYYSFGSEILFIILFVFLNSLNIFIIRSYFVIVRIKGRSVHFFIFGSISFLVLGNIGAYFKMINRNDLSALGFEPMMFTYLGVIIEALVFTNIMGNIFKQIMEKKSNLKVQIAMKQKESAELKMIALQSQMNPHFLFNSLNSINNYVIKNEKEAASEYISAFAKLVRLTLKNSESPQISLFEELKVLDVYVKLEKNRLVGGFRYEKNIDTKLNLHDIMVPPLFLQPFIENSIWHGLAGKKGEKCVKLDVFEVDNCIWITIEDNGLGIDEQVTNRNRESSKKKFFGSFATEKRIKLMYNSDRVTVSTRNIASGSETGTRVTINFPKES